MSFTVTETAKHEDGSATFEVSGSAEDMQRLFEAFFTSALINGIDYATEYKDNWIAKQKLIDAAIEMQKAIWAWKNFDGVDWVDLEEIEKRFNTAIEEYKK